jgi:hypothetical protein
MLNWRLNSIYRFNYLLFVISLSLVTLAGLRAKSRSQAASAVGWDKCTRHHSPGKSAHSDGSQPISGGPQSQDVLCSEPTPDWAAKDRWPAGGRDDRRTESLSEQA